jgi:osmotically-inducible protein OsmY
MVENRLAVAPSKDIIDEAIAEDIVAAFNRDILVEPEDVTVTVNDGIVTLTGVVPAWSSLQAAENDAAHTAGVVGVDNQLKVAV